MSFVRQDNTVTYDPELDGTVVVDYHASHTKIQEDHKKELASLQTKADLYETEIARLRAEIILKNQTYQELQKKYDALESKQNKEKETPVKLPQSPLLACSLMRSDNAPSNPSVGIQTDPEPVLDYGI